MSRCDGPSLVKDGGAAEVDVSAGEVADLQRQDERKLAECGRSAAHDLLSSLLVRTCLDSVASSKRKTVDVGACLFR